MSDRLGHNMANQLEDADRRGFDPYDQRQVGQTAAEFTGQVRNPTESAAQESDDSPPVEPEPGTVVGFTKRFRPDGPGYAYVAIRIKGKGWYVTGSAAVVHGKTWAELLELADGAQLWVTRDWTTLS